MELPEYRNEPYVDFNDPAHADAMERALADVRAQFGKTYPLVIDGEQIVTEKTIAHAIGPPGRRWATLSARSSRPRARLGGARPLGHGANQRRGARGLPGENRRDHARPHLQLSARMIHEVNKNWAEAHADVAEAIDFASTTREMRLAGPQQVYQLPGEHAEMQYISCAGLAIPLNFAQRLPPAWCRPRWRRQHRYSRRAAGDRSSLMEILAEVVPAGGQLHHRRRCVI